MEKKSLGGNKLPKVIQLVAGVDPDLEPPSVMS